MIRGWNVCWLAFWYVFPSTAFPIFDITILNIKRIWVKGQGRGGPKLLSTLRGTKLFLLTSSHSCSLLASLDLKDYIYAKSTTKRPNCYSTLLLRLTLSVSLILVSVRSCFISWLTSVSRSISFDKRRFFIKKRVLFRRDQSLL